MDLFHLEYSVSTDIRIGSVTEENKIARACKLAGG
jgi:hypothetical protein